MKMSDPRDRKSILWFTYDTFCKFKVFLVVCLFAEAAQSVPEFECIEKCNYFADNTSMQHPVSPLPEFASCTFTSCNCSLYLPNFNYCRYFEKGDPLISQTTGWAVCPRGPFQLISCDGETSQGLCGCYTWGSGPFRSGCDCVSINRIELKWVSSWI